MKRFTATEKWKDPWFRKLPVAYKAFFLYLCDECDNAGFIDPDKDLASFIVGASLDLQEALNHFDGRVKVLPSGKWHLTKFIQFQYGELNEANPCHRGVLRIIKERTSEAPTKDLQRGLQAPQEKEKEKRKETDKEEGSTEGRFRKPTLEEVKLLFVKSGGPESEAIKFFNHYESNGWKVGRNPMKSVQHAAGGWIMRWKENKYGTKNTSSNPTATPRRDTNDPEAYACLGTKIEPIPAGPPEDDVPF